MPALGPPLGFDEVQIGWVMYVSHGPHVVKSENNENNFRSLFRALLLVINSSVLGPLHFKCALFYSAQF